MLSFGDNNELIVISLSLDWVLMGVNSSHNTTHISSNPIQISMVNLSEKAKKFWSG